MGINRAAAAKNDADGAFVSHVVNRMVGRGHGCIWVPVDVMVSDLETPLVGLEVRMNSTYQKQFHSLFQRKMAVSSSV
jgi:hypothetical protein